MMPDAQEQEWSEKRKEVLGDLDEIFNKLDSLFSIEVQGALDKFVALEDIEEQIEADAEVNERYQDVAEKIASRTEERQEAREAGEAAA